MSSKSRSIGRQCLAATLLGLAGLAGGAHAADLNFIGFSLESGTALQAGAVYRFDDVTTDVDALVTVVSLNNGGTLNQIDDTVNPPPNGGFWEALQPQVSGNDGSVTFDIAFVDADTSTSTSLSSFLATAIDVDGDSGNLRELVEFSGFDSFALTATTNLTPTVVGSATRFQPMTSDTEPGISTGATDNAVNLSYGATSSFQITVGSEGNSSAFPRLSSLHFDQAFVIVPAADVSIAKTLDTAGPFIDGQQVTYTLTVSNNGTDTATNVVVNDTPSNVTINTVSGACTALPCSILSIPSGGTETITVVGTVSPP